MNAPTERRATRRARLYWEQLGGQDRLPMLQQIRPDRVPFDWADALVAEFEPQAGGFVLVHVGAALLADCGKDMLRKPVAAAPPNSLLGATLASHAEVAHSGAPAERAGEIRGTRGAGHMLLFRSILLPFRSRSPDRTDAVLGVAGCRLVSDSGEREG